MAVGVIGQLATFVQPFADFYGDSKPMIIGATTMHLGGLLAGGGIAIATDRSIVRTSRADAVAQRRVIAEVASTHAYVITALVFIITSGLVFLAADLNTFVSSPVYWFKMTVVVVLLANGFRLRHTEKRLSANLFRHPEKGAPDSRAWNTLRVCAVTSLVAWFTILVCGVVLANL